jgi:type VI secretion system protein ImpL
VRGVVVLFPVPWASRGEAVPEAGALRDDLQAIRRILRVNCPIYAVVPGMETVPGFTEFLQRMARQVGPQMLERRVGFGIPDTRVFSGELISSGLVWLSGWFGTWTGSLMAGDPLNHDGNAELATLDSEIRRYRKRFRAICEAAFLTPSESEPLLFRGLYLVGSGREASSQGFAAGLLRGARSLIPSDHSSTRWTAEAQADDRRHIVAALAVAAVGLFLSLIIWMPLVRKSGLASVGLLLLAIAWAVVGFRAGRSVWRATRAAAQPTT